MNYVKLNQGYDDQEESDSNFTTKTKQKLSKRIKKSKNLVHRKINSKEKMKNLCDNLGILLDWKKKIKIKAPENKQQLIKSLHVVKNISKCDISKLGQNIQGMWINISWKTPTNPNGTTIQELKNLTISPKLMSNGIVFIWTDKKLLSDIIESMSEKGFSYIENFVTVNLKARVAFNELIKHKPDLNKQNHQDVVLENLEFLQDKIQVKDMLDNRTYEYLSNSKRTLLMFRKFDSKQLELRHQRTSDVLFDLVDDDCTLSQKTKEYIYQMIETLLPKADNYKLMELWANENHPRANWISVVENKKK